MRLGFDLRIHRYPPGGTTSYADWILGRMAELRPDGWQVVPVAGWPRLPRRTRLPAPIRRGANLALDLGWLTLGGPAEAARGRFGAWFAPGGPLPCTLRQPSVVIIYGIDFMLLPHLYEPGFRRVAAILARVTARRASRIVAPSDYTRRTIVEHLGVLPEKVTTIPFGLDHLPAPDPRNQHPRPYALFVGQTQPEWNVGVLLDAWRSGAGGELDLVISGPIGRDEPGLRGRVEQEGLAKRVYFTGHLPSPRLMALIRDADIFLYPALADGRGMPPLEAMLFGVPTAVSNRGALVEVTKGAALTFDPDDPDALVDVVTRLREDDELRRRLRREGPEVARRYRWDDAVTGYWREVQLALDA